MGDIKPCPFCGREADYWEDNQYQDRHVIECGSCGANKRSEYGYDHVLEDWNRRYDSKGNEMVDTKTTRYRPRIVAHGEDGGETFIIKESRDTYDDAQTASAAANEMAKAFRLGTQVIEV